MQSLNILLVHQKGMHDPPSMKTERGLLAPVSQFHHSQGPFSERMCLPATFLLHTYHASRFAQAITSQTTACRALKALRGWICTLSDFNLPLCQMLFTQACFIKCQAESISYSVKNCKSKIIHGIQMYTAECTTAECTTDLNSYTRTPQHIRVQQVNNLFFLHPVNQDSYTSEFRFGNNLTSGKLEVCQ